MSKSRMTARIAKIFTERLVRGEMDDVTPAVNRRLDRYFELVDTPDVREEIAGLFSQTEIQSLRGVCQHWIEPAREARTLVIRDIENSPNTTLNKQLLIAKVSRLSTLALVTLIEQIEGR